MLLGQACRQHNYNPILINAYRLTTIIMQLSTDYQALHIITAVTKLRAIHNALLTTILNTILRSILKEL